MRPVEAFWEFGPLMMVCCAGSVDFRVEEGQSGTVGGEAHKAGIVPIDPVVLTV